ncbi:MAG: prepilin-type N-terminal cleavage/methylation domain-containing protein [Gemmatimonadota bacterium]
MTPPTLDHVLAPRPLSVGVSGRCTARQGVTLVELLVVMSIVAITLTLGIQAYSSYSDQNAAQRAGEMFTRDLGVTRSTAVRERQSVSLCLQVDSMRYEIVTAAGRSVAIRHFGEGSPHRLSGMELNLTGECVIFDRRGLADLTGASGAVGTLELRSNSATSLVTFNAMGVTRVEAR